MKDRLMNLALIFCSLLVASIFAQHQVKLYPVHSQSHQHTGYAAKVMIGDPEKEFTLLLDTVTLLLWVTPPYHIHPFCENKQTYSCFESDTCIGNYPRFLQQLYGYRSVSVCEYREDISFPSLNGTRVDFPNSPFGIMNSLHWHKWEDYQQIDGVLGLSALHVFNLPHEIFDISTLRVHFVENPIKRAIRKRKLDPFITIALPSLDKTAMLTLGGRNNELCDLQNEITEPLRTSYPYTVFHIIDQSRNRYEIKYNSIKMGNAVFSTNSTEAFAYPHTIKPYIGVPDVFLNEIVQNLNAKLDLTTSKYMVDCEGTFESFEISTQNNTYIVESKHFIIKHNQNDTLCELAFGGRKGNYPDAVVLGIPFFHQYCVTLKPLDKEISFAPII